MSAQQQAKQSVQTHDEALPSAIEEILIETGARNGLSPRNQYELLRSQIAPGCTDDELAHFLYVCKSRGLDPFAKQAYAIRRQSYDRASRSRVWRMTIQTGIDGFRVIAKRAGLEAQDEPEFTYDDQACDPDLNPLGLVKCTVRVWKLGSTRPTTTSAYWDEYRQTADEYEDGQKSGRKKLAGKWFDMPRTMLAKVAEALTLRRAFPEDLGGLYTTEEMGQATTEQQTQPALRPVAKPVAVAEAGETPESLEAAITSTTTEAELVQMGKRLVEAKIGEDDRKRLRGVYAHQRNRLRKQAKEAAPPEPAPIPDAEVDEQTARDAATERQPGEDG